MDNDKSKLSSVKKDTSFFSEQDTQLDLSEIDELLAKWSTLNSEYPITTSNSHNRLERTYSDTLTQVKSNRNIPKKVYNFSCIPSPIHSVSRSNIFSSEPNISLLSSEQLSTDEITTQGFIPTNKNRSSPALSYEESTKYIPPIGTKSPREFLGKLFPDKPNQDSIFINDFLMDAKDFLNSSDDLPGNFSHSNLQTKTASKNSLETFKESFPSVSSSPPKTMYPTGPESPTRRTRSVTIPLGSTRNRKMVDSSRSKLLEPNQPTSPEVKPLSRDRSLQRAAGPSPNSLAKSLPTKLQRPSNKNDDNHLQVDSVSSSYTHLRGVSEGGDCFSTPDSIKNHDHEQIFYDPLIDTMHPNRSPPQLMYPSIYATGTVRCVAISGKTVLVGGLGLRGWDVTTGKMILNIGGNWDYTRVSSIIFLPSRYIDDEGVYAWFGTNEGQLNHLNIFADKIIDRRASLHQYSIINIFRFRNSVITLDESGVFQIWPERNELGELLASITFNKKPRGSKIALNKGDLVIFAGGQLWVASTRSLSVYEILTPSPLRLISHDIDYNDGLITSMSFSGSLGWVIMGHSDGKLSIWNMRSRLRQGTVQLSSYRITSILIILDRYLWVAIANKIYVYDLSPSQNKSGPKTWLLRKEFIAHDAPIVLLASDAVGLLTSSQLLITSVCENGQIKFWDGLLSEDWQANRLESRREEYCLLRQIQVRICSWNIGACKPSDLLNRPSNAVFLESWLFPDLSNPPDLLIVGFQEIVDLESTAINAKSLFRKKEETGEHITQRYNKWQNRLIKAINESKTGYSYKLVECQNLIGLFICVFIKDVEFGRINDIEISSTKTGFGGFHGNKGAVIVRFTWDDTSLCFANCHLAAGQTQVAARNSDVSTILKKTFLPPVRPIMLPSIHDKSHNLSNLDTVPLFVNGGDGQNILDHEICFLSGDLNYRIDLPREKVDYLIRYKEWEQLQEYDQLVQLRRGKLPFMLRLFQESSIRFAPTYKYNLHTDEYDTSDKRRCPAWCDRILFRGAEVNAIDYKRSECDLSDHRPISATFSCLIKTILPEKYRLARQEATDSWSLRCNSHMKHRMVHHLEHLGYSYDQINSAFSHKDIDLIQVSHLLYEQTRNGKFLTYE